MKRFFLLSFFAIAFTTMSGQPYWEWQYPSPQSNDLNAIKVFNKDTFITIGKCGIIVMSMDGGSSWIFPRRATQNHLTKIFFLNDTMGWIAAKEGTILKTINGGLDWTSTSPAVISGFNVEDIAFTDPLHGWISCTSILLGYGYYSSTTDGGITWTTPVILANGPMKSIYFANATTGWMFYGGQYTWKTTDGGQTWVQQAFISGVSAYYSSDFKDSLTGYMSGSNGVLLKTVNGGVNWTHLTSNTTYSLFGLEMENDSTIWATGYMASPFNPGCILRSTDNGLTWNTMMSVNYRDYRDIGIGDDSTIYVVGNNGKITKSTDDGTTWNSIVVGYKSMQQCVHFSDSLHGWAGDDLGHVFHTADGGQSWSTDNFTIDISGVFGINDDTAFALNTTWVRKTYDGGVTWTGTNLHVGLYGIFFPTPESGWVVGDNGTIFHTTDYGTTWTAISSAGSDPYYDIWFTDSLHGWIVGGSGSSVRRTSDGGNTWPTIYSAGNTGFGTIHFYDTLNGVMTSGFYFTMNGGPLSVTHDGGYTWTAYNSGGTDAILTDPIHGVIASGNGYSGGMFSFELYGSFLTWEYEEVVLSGENYVQIMYEMWWLDDNTAWAVGDGGSIFRYTGRCNIPHPVITVNGNLLSAPQGQVAYAWYLNGFPLPASASTYSPTVSGYYIVSVVDTNGCEIASDAVYWTSPSSTQSDIQPFQVKLYPNPSEGRSILVFPSIADNHTIEVTDATGGEVFLAETQEDHFSLEGKNLSPGFYMIKITENKNGVISCSFLKWIIQ